MAEGENWERGLENRVWLDQRILPPPTRSKLQEGPCPPVIVVAATEYTCRTL